MIFSLTFKALIHFEFSFVTGVSTRCSRRCSLKRPSRPQ